MITLTYATENLPFPEIKPFGIVSYDDLNKFKKRFKTQWLRTYGYHPNFIHYGIAEYSPDELRPHYHFFIAGDDPHKVKKIVDATWKLGITNMQIITQLDLNKEQKSLNNLANYVIGHNFKEDSYIDKLSSQHTKPFTVRSRGIGMNITSDISQNFIKKNMLPIQGFTKYERYLLDTHEAFHDLDYKISEYSGLVKTCAETGKYFVNLYSTPDDPIGLSSFTNPNFKGILSFISPYMIRKIAKLVAPDVVETLEYIRDYEPVPLAYASVLEADIKQSKTDHDEYLESDERIQNKKSMSKRMRIKRSKKQNYKHRKHQ